MKLKRYNPWHHALEVSGDNYTKEQVYEMTLGEVEELIEIYI